MNISLGQYAKITCSTATLTHYIVVKKGDSALYMATHAIAEPSVDEIRFIARSDPAKLPLDIRSAASRPQAAARPQSKDPTSSSSIASHAASSIPRSASSMTERTASIVRAAMRSMLPILNLKIGPRAVTRGAYKGNGEMYNVAIPAGTLQSGENTITIDAISGNGEEGVLSPSIILDAMQLFQ
ncbi:hypothetical protein H2203_007893 [Taxawa tesnikishii (nom. ined.)]|nr:hypothetical protein H2203_007893 [Dothideales sp. JES 119]